jgi:glycerate dehydrogenase
VQHTIVFLDRESVGANVREPSFPHSYNEYEATWTPDEIVERLKDASIAIINKVPMRADTLKQLPKLKLIAVAATGTDVVDKAYCKEAGITVVNIRNYAFNTVPEHVIALMFALRRNLLAYVEDVRNGRWGKVNQFCFFDHPIRDIAGSTLGVVGYGAIGKAVAKRAECLGMRILPFDVVPQPGLVDFDTILKESDVITLHVPLTAETKNMIGTAELKKMKPTAILINTARGPVVDEAALARALAAKRLAGAALDVWEQEPVAADNPLLGMDNVIATPHAAYFSSPAVAQVPRRCGEEVARALRGQRPVNVVNPEVYAPGAVRRAR